MVCGLDVVETVRSYTWFSAVKYDMVHVTVGSIKLMGCSSMFAFSVVQAKMQQVQDPGESNVDSLNNVRHKAIRHFRNKKKEYMKAKIEELETNSKIKNIRDLYMGIIEFKKG